MIGQDRILALIPARGGSKGVPGKNIRPLANKPLIGWTIESALTCPEIDTVIVSTDCPDISAASRAAGAEVIDRPAHISGDSALVIDAIRHAIETLESNGEKYNIVVLLQPTTPFRPDGHISAGLAKFQAGAYDSLTCFKTAGEPFERLWVHKGDEFEVFIDGANPWLPRQELTPAWHIDGSLYIIRTASIPADATGLFFGKFGGIQSDYRWHVDIDDEIDLNIAEAMAHLMQNQMTTDET